MKILIVEDDPSTSELLSAALTANHYVVDLAADGKTGLELAGLWEYDLIILDVELPALSGIEVCRAIRARGSRIPILMLTAKQADEDVITGLDAGADDYMIKPCSLNQLLAKIRSLLRRSAEVSSPHLQWGGLCLDSIAYRVTYERQEIALRPKEYMLLELFLRSPQRIFSRSAILDHLWTVDNFPTEGAVTNLIKDLRQRLTAAGVPEDFIETLYGLGYRLKAMPKKQEQSSRGTLPEKTIETTIETAVAVEPNPSSSSPAAGSAAGSAADSVEQLGQEFRASVQQRLQQLVEAAQQMRSGQLPLDRWRMLKAEAHRLAGSLGMYGYPKASEVARSLDRLLANTEPAELPRSLIAEQVIQWLSELRQDVDSSAVSPVEPSQISLAPLVLMVSEDDQWAEAVQQEARHWDLRIEVIPDFSPAQQQFIADTPTVIVLDMDSAMLDEETLGKITHQFRALPVFMLAEQDNLANRVAAARLGIVRYLVKPIAPAQLFETITPLLPQVQTSDRAKVLVVDDDPLVHPIVARLLQPWGLDTIGLREPEQFWQVLTQTNPDLVLLDLEMPKFNGIELCRVVRQDVRYSDLPILVITAHIEPGEIRQVFDAGADDLLHKPIVDSELVTRVINRIERSRLRKQLDQLRRQQSQSRQQQSMIDALTQIPNRRAFDQFLQRVWQQHQTEQLPLALIVCDVDRFRHYNDRYGYPAGDGCLQQIAHALQQCLKSGTDAAARCGGEEFAIVLPNTTLSGAVNVAERVQQAIAQLKIPFSNADRYADVTADVTLSLGITGTVPTANQTIENLVAMANRALYAAKEKGRNTYCLYPL